MSKFCPLAIATIGTLKHNASSMEFHPQCFLNGQKIMVYYLINNFKHAGYGVIVLLEHISFGQLYICTY